MNSRAFTKIMILWSILLLLGMLLINFPLSTATAFNSAAPVPLSTAFTYQGELQDGGVPANGIYDFEFRLFDGPTLSDTLIGAPLLMDNITVTNGLFTTQLDFGAAVFTGDARWLAISVGPDGGALTALDPLQPLTAAPYALYGEDADADPANELNSTAVLSGTILELTDAGGTLTTDLSLLIDDADADPGNELNSTAVLSGTILELTDAGGTLITELSSLIDDADADPANELNNTLALNGNNLELTDAGGTLTADLTALIDTDWVYASGSGLTGDIYHTGDVGINTTTPATQLHVAETSSVPIAAVKVEGVFGPTNGYLGVQGDTDHDGVITLDISGNEIAVLGVSMGSSSTDNAGVYGHSNGWGGIFEHSDGISVTSRVEIAGSGADINIYDANGNLNMRVNEANLNIYGDNGNLNARINENGANNGRFSLYNSLGNRRVDLFVDGGNDAGGVRFIGPNSNNFTVGNLSGFPDHGFVGVVDAAGANQAGIYVDSAGDGIVFGDVKSFRMDHPENPDQEIWYASLEGPEVAAYTRGTAQLVDGKATITLPDHFSLVVNELSMTTLLTPRSAASKGLAVISQNGKSITVQELHNGRGTYLFDWEIKGVRQGFETFAPVRDALELSGGSVQPISTETAEPLTSTARPTEVQASEIDLLKAENEALRQDIAEIKAMLTEAEPTTLPVYLGSIFQQPNMSTFVFLILFGIVQSWYWYKREVQNEA